MKTINLAILSQLHGNDAFSVFETVYSRRENNTTPLHEQESLFSFVRYLIQECDIHFPQMNGFYFSYHIPQISKEFDLLRLSDMKKYIAYANSIGVRANGFWSVRDDTQKKHPMTKEQFSLRDTILGEEFLPANLDLLVINRASETCIKIDGKKRKVDYMIVHNSDKETQIQVRGRYHGDLPTFYYHDIEAANHYACQHIPDKYLNVRLYGEERDELCAFLHLRKEKDPYNGYYKWPTVRAYLMKNGYSVTNGIKDSKRNGQYYYVLSLQDTNLGEPL